MTSSLLVPSQLLSAVVRSYHGRSPVMRRISTNGSISGAASLSWIADAASSRFTYPWKSYVSGGDHHEQRGNPIWRAKKKLRQNKRSDDDTLLIPLESRLALANRIATTLMGKTRTIALGVLATATMTRLYITQMSNGCYVDAKFCSNLHRTPLPTACCLLGRGGRLG